MNADPIEGLSALLIDAEAAHGTYESTVLNGVYDKDWAQWYAAYAVEHGVGGLVGHAFAVERLAAFLASTFADYERSAPEGREPWATYTARRIAADP